MDSAQRTYLATQIFSEQATVSYRSVARALKLHVNTAKKLLGEFKETENGKRPGSVCATYLISGVKKVVGVEQKTNGIGNGTSKPRKGESGEDEEMYDIASSPPPFTSSMLQSSQQDGGETVREAVRMKTITLVREDGLEAMKEQYESITSIHIYCLSAYRIQDLVALTDIGRELFTNVFIKEDPLQHNKAYGVIQNKDVRRRSLRRPLVSEATVPKFIAVKEEGSKSAAMSSGESKPSAQPRSSVKKELSRPGSSGSMASESSTAKPGLKRDTSDIFKSFAKAKSKLKLERKGTDTSNNTGSPPGESKVFGDTDDEELEGEAMFLDTGTTRTSRKKRGSDESVGDTSKSQKEERAAKLRKMMDSDDEDQEPKKEREEDAAKMADGGSAEEAAWSESDTEKSKVTTNGMTSTPAAEPATNTETQRQRGKRKVMKKRTMKDEEGYLVTKEEAIWESFSEDEVRPQSSKPKTAFPAKSFTQSQGKGPTKSEKGAAKSAGKGGNIMSFFGKK